MRCWRHRENLLKAAQGLRPPSDEFQEVFALLSDGVVPDGVPIQEAFGGKGRLISVAGLVDERDLEALGAQQSLLKLISHLGGRDPQPQEVGELRIMLIALGGLLAQQADFAGKNPDFQAQSETLKQIRGRYVELEESLSRDLSSFPDQLVELRQLEKLRHRQIVHLYLNQDRLEELWDE